MRSRHQHGATQSGPNPWRGLTFFEQRDRRRRIRRRSLVWAIKISAPDDETSSRWGDTAFAQDLADALEQLGQVVSIHRLGAHPSPPSGRYDVVLVLRGLHRIEPLEGSLDYLWIISHPDAVDDDELAAGWNRVFAASMSWDRSAEIGAQPLLQAASARRFTPRRDDLDHYDRDVLFVGTSRGVERPVVRDAVAVGADLKIYGHDWDRFAPESAIGGDHLPFAEVPAAYSSARIVLNDHWEDMRRCGFLSNRLFDATFAGARVVSDSVPNMSEVFGDLVQTYVDLPDLTTLLTDRDRWPSGAKRDAAIAELRLRHSFDARASTLLTDALEDFRRTRRGR